tara:strand:+ start:904 stop:1215 length:312 start_codon:yes stop_codon:yes gene_type:complete
LVEYPFVLGRSKKASGEYCIIGQSAKECHRKHASHQFRALRDRGEFRDLMIARGDLCLDILNLTLERNTASALTDETISFEEDSGVWGRFSSAKKVKKKRGFH